MKTDVKICPILSTAKHMADIVGCNNGAVQCQEEECAWWCEWTKACALVAVAAELSDRLTEIRGAIVK